MNVVDILGNARSAGVEIGIDGADLLMSAKRQPPTALLDLISRHKPAILAYLARGSGGWTPEEWIAFFDERAGIAEHAGGQTRKQAETTALACCVAEWMNRNPVSSPPDRCLHCGGSSVKSDPLLPFGGKSTGHAWLHGRCWAAWHAGRKKQALVALATAGVWVSTEPNSAQIRKSAA